MSASDGVTVDRSKAAGGRLTFVGVLLVLLGLALQIGVFMIAAHSVPDASAITLRMIELGSPSAVP